MLKSKRVAITIFSICILLIVGMLATIIVFAAQMQRFDSNVNVLYVAKDISGSVSATYKLGDGASPVSLVKSGTQQTTITFNPADNNVNGVLVPTSSLEFTVEKEYILFEYTFNNFGDKPYYVSVSYSDTSGDDKNISIQYSLDQNSSFSTSPVKATVPKATFSGSTMQTAGTQKYYIKVSVNSFVTDATFSGRFYWTLSNEELASTYVEGNSTLYFNEDIYNGERVENIKYTLNGETNYLSQITIDNTRYHIPISEDRINEVNIASNTFPIDMFSIIKSQPEVIFEINVIKYSAVTLTAPNVSSNIKVQYSNNGLDYLDIEDDLFEEVSSYSNFFIKVSVLDIDLPINFKLIINISNPTGGSIM